MARFGEHIQTAYQDAYAHLAPILRRWWENPLWRHARRMHPLPLRLLRYALPAAALFFTLLVVLAWALRWRALGAALMGLSLATVLMPLLIAPVTAAGRVAHQMASPTHDPRRLADLDPSEVAWGLTCVALWRWRWLLVMGLTLTPVLIVSLVRLEAASLLVWHGSAQILGAVTAAGRAGETLAGGGLPYLRLVLRAVSGALLPWAALPLFVALGVTAALALGDVGLAPLVVLLGEAVAVPLLALLWNILSATPVLAGPYEGVRLLTLTALLAGLPALTALPQQLSERLLSAAQTPPAE